MFSADKPIHVLGRTLIRDILFYLFALCILISASIIGEMHLLIGIAFLTLYVIYVIYVVIQDKIDERIKKKHREERNSIAVRKESHAQLTVHDNKILEMQDVEEDEAYLVYDQDMHLIDVEVPENLEEEQNYVDRRQTRFRRLFASRATNNEGSLRVLNPEYDEDKRNSQHYKIQDNQSLISDNTNSQQTSLLSPSKVPHFMHGNSSLAKKDRDACDQIHLTKIHKSGDIGSMVMKDYVDEEQDSQRFTEKFGPIKEKGKIQETRVKIVWSMLKMKRFLVNGIENEQPFAQMSIINKLFFIFLDAPFNFIRRLTIPPGSEDLWNRNYACVSPFFSIFFIFAVTGFFDFTSSPPIAFYIAEGIAILLGVVFWFTTPKTKAPKKLMLFFAIACFALSILWIFFIANILVDLITLLGIILNLDSAFLGITILAMGMSIADLKVNAAVAKQGLARMALTG
jgi:Ca2+/Na+ antiporter